MNMIEFANLEELFKQITIFMADIAETGAAIIITLAVLQAIWQAFSVFAAKRKGSQTNETIRIQLARWLALGLEFELAADILRTAAIPTWNEIGQLAAIVVLRTVLNYFIDLEIERAERKKHGTA